MSTQWIAVRLASVGRSQADLARALKLDPSGVTRIIKGERQIKADEAPKIAKLLEVSVDYLLKMVASAGPGVSEEPPLRDLWATQRVVATHVGSAGSAVDPTSILPAQSETSIQREVSPFTANDLPVYGTAVGGTEGWYDMNGQPIDRVHRPPQLMHVVAAYAVYMVGTSMEPRFYAGETLYVHPGKPITPHCFVVVQFKPHHEGEAPRALVKQFIKKDAEKLVLRQFNPPDNQTLTFPIRDVISIHRVVLAGDG